MLIVIGLSFAAGLGLLSVRSMALAFSNTVDVNPRPVASRGEVARRRKSSYLRSSEAAVLTIEVLLSVGIAAAVVGLASMAALPGHLIVGALLAQAAVIGALIAPAVTVHVGAVHVRPAAVALGLAQLANVVFFWNAIRALV